MQWALQTFVDESGIDVSYDRRAVSRIRDAAEQAKIRLSSEPTTRLFLENICVDDDGRPLNLDIAMSRDQLEKLTEDLVDRSMVTCERILGEAGSSREQLDEVLLVGGQSRMPMVRQKLEIFAGKPPSHKVHPDEAVAIGASIMAHSLSSKAGPQDMTLLDVLPMAIGISKTDGSMHVLFAKNQPLPDYKTRTLMTSKDNQRSIMLRIYQGESKFVAENELLGTFVFSGLREAVKGAVKIEVTFHIDSEGILNLTARDIDTGQLVESRLKLGKDGEAAPTAAVGGKKKVAKKKPVQGPEEVEDQESAPPPAPLAMPTSSLTMKPTLGSAPRGMDNDEPAPLDDSAAAPAVKTRPHTDGPRSSPPSAAPASAPAVVAQPELGLFGRMIAWFRGLFGRK